jgi:hypothetical protein
MKVEQVVFSLRLTERVNKYIRKKSIELGISQNSFMLLLIDLGKRVYESKVSFNPLKK